MLTPEQLIEIAEQCFDEPLKSEIATEKNKTYGVFEKKGVYAYFANNIGKVGIYDEEGKRYLPLLTVIFHAKTFEVRANGFMCRFDTAKAVDMIRNFKNSQSFA